MSRRLVSASCLGVLSRRRRSRRRKAKPKTEGEAEDGRARARRRESVAHQYCQGFCHPFHGFRYYFCAIEGFGASRLAVARLLRPHRSRTMLTHGALHPVAIGMSPAEAGSEFRSLARAWSFSIFICPAGRENFPRGGREFRLSAREFPLRGENFANGVCEICGGHDFRKIPIYQAGGACGFLSP